MVADTSGLCFFLGISGIKCVHAWRVFYACAEVIIGGCCYSFFVGPVQKEFDGACVFAQVRVRDEGVCAAVVPGFGLEVSLVYCNIV